MPNTHCSIVISDQKNLTCKWPLTATVSCLDINVGPRLSFWPQNPESSFFLFKFFFNNSKVQICPYLFSCILKMKNCSTLWIAVQIWHSVIFISWYFSILKFCNPEMWHSDNVAFLYFSILTFLHYDIFGIMTFLALWHFCHYDIFASFHLIIFGILAFWHIGILALMLHKTYSYVTFQTNKLVCFSMPNTFKTLMGSPVGWALSLTRKC